VLNAHASSLAGELPVDAARPQVWVDDAANADRARSLIDEYLGAPSGPPVQCAKCGEENPGSFEVCWNCREPLA
jgi:hypothetical protein